MELRYLRTACDTTWENRVLCKCPIHLYHAPRRPWAHFHPQECIPFLNELSLFLIMWLWSNSLPWNRNLAPLAGTPETQAHNRLSDKNDWINFYLLGLYTAAKKLTARCGRGWYPEDSLLSDRCCFLCVPHMSSLWVSSVPVPSSRENTNPSTQLDDLILS